MLYTQILQGRVQMLSHRVDIFLPLLLGALAVSPLLLQAEPAQSRDLPPLTERAREEIRQPGRIKATPNDVQVSQSMLSLEDPLREVRQRLWDYKLGLGLQMFRPSGTVRNDFTSSDFNLSDNGSTVLPALIFGAQGKLLEQPRWQMDWGLSGRVGYISQKAKARFDSGFVESNVRLNTFMLGVGPQLNFVMNRVPWLTTVVGAEVGRLTYTQVSSNDLANLSKRANYQAWLAGFDFRLNPTWSLYTRYSNRQLSSAPDQMQVQANNWEAGTQIVW